MGATVREAAANLLVQLFAGLDPDADRLASKPDAERLLAAVLGHIDAHLGEADLTPARIAAAHNISVRTRTRCSPKWARRSARTSGSAG
jgi:hypothetical protein